MNCNINFKEYITKLLYNEALYTVLNSHEIDLIVERHINHKTVAEIAFERSVEYSKVQRVIDSSESKIIRYAEYIGDI